MTTRSVSRRQLFRGHLRERTAIRPPWALAELAFLDSCDRCGDCIRACAEGIIAKGSGGYPEVRFESAGCTLCGECRAAGAGRALTGDPRWDPPFPHGAVIGTACIARGGVTCRSCGEACEVGAIAFRLRLGGPALPELDPGVCTGCGLCLGPCPSQAIRMETGADPIHQATPAKGTPVYEHL
jgi:ferredoxin-type protein NapF